MKKKSGTKSTKYNKRRRNGRDNRRWNDTLYVLAIPLKLSIAIVMAVVIIISYVVTRQSCDSLLNEIARQETRQEDLMDELQRERTKWDNMKTPRGLETRLLKHGIAMASPRAGQRIAMSTKSIPTGATIAPTEYASAR